MRLRTLLLSAALAVGLTLNAGALAQSQPRQALLIGLSQYLPSVGAPPLTGVPYDMSSAERIAQGMGIEASQIVSLRDAQATKAGILAALERLNAQAPEGARALVYFSGHGTRYFDQSAQGCVEGLLTYDGQTITHREFAQALQGLNQRADKVITFFDACHSGGVSGIAGGANRTRSVTANLLQPKFFLKSDAQSSACSVPTNMRTRGLLGESTRLGAIQENLVQITSSRPDEVSFDEPGKGGLATQGIRDCLLGQAKDLNGSGSVTMDEVQTCAQAFVDQRLQGVADLKPHHISVSGNRNIIPVQRPPTAVAAPVAAPAPAVASTPPPAPTPALATAPSTASADTRPPSSSPATGVANAVAAVVPAPAAVKPPPPPPAASTAQTATPAAAPVMAATPPAAPPAPAPAPVATANQPPATGTGAAATGAAATVAAATPATPVSVPSPAPQRPTAAVAPPAPAPVVEPAVASLASLQDVYSQRNPRREVKVQLASSSLRIGKDDLRLRVRSSHDGYVYFVMLGSDAKSFYVLFPNGLDRDHRIKAGQTLSLPRPSWQLRAAGPAGTDQLLVLVTQTPRAVDRLVMAEPDAQNPFTFALNDFKGRAALVRFLTQSADPSQSDQFGAALLSIKEVP